MYVALIVVQVLLAIALIALVLLQHGKGADAGAAFGSGASATVFGARGSGSFLSRTTGILAALFFVNSLALSTPYVTGRNRQPVSVTQQVPVPETAPAPKAPEAAPPKAPASAPAEPADVPDVPTGSAPAK